MPLLTSNFEQLGPVGLSTNPSRNGLNDERWTDSVLDSEASLASERVLGSGHVETDSTSDQNPQLID